MVSEAARALVIPLRNMLPMKIYFLSYQAFVPQLDRIQIPQTIQDAVKDPKWKKRGG